LILRGQYLVICRYHSNITGLCRNYEVFR